MSYRLNKDEADALFRKLGDTYDIYAPKRFPKEGRYSDTDVIKYDKVSSLEEIEHQEKSTYPMKEVLNPIQQTIFYFTEDEFRESKVTTRPLLVFARPCDINAQKIQYRILVGNGGKADFYYQRMREKVHFVLMECNGGDDDCFCVSVNANKTDDYSLAFRFLEDGGLLVKANDPAFIPLLSGDKEESFEPVFTEKNDIKAEMPEIPDRETLNALKAHPMWKEFDSRCISCGACTIACSTCTCFTQRDVVYGDNPNVGERRRVAASCQVDGFSDLAGGASFRKTAGERMRFKMLHKFHDYGTRFGGVPMCVGCGRCTARCPQFISITVTLNKMNQALEEIKAQKEETKK